MALPSASSDSVVFDEELVRDAALCLRSFYGSRDVIPYSKFCERFKKNFGYSVKDQLKSSAYTFADVMQRVSTTTRTKFEYDPEQKLITLMPERTPEITPHLLFPVPPTVVQPTPLFVPFHPFEPHIPAFVPQAQTFMYPRTPVVAGSEPLRLTGGAHNSHQINTIISSVTSVQSTQLIDDRVSNDDRSRIKIVEEDRGMNETSQPLTSVPWSIYDTSEQLCERIFNQNTIADENCDMTTDASLSLSTIPWSTCDTLGLQHEQNIYEDAVCDLTSVENYIPKLNEAALPLESQDEKMHDWRRQDLRGLNGNVAYVPWSSLDESGQPSTVEHFGESDDSYYYDAEEELGRENPPLPPDNQDFPWNQYELNSTVDYDECVRSEASTSVAEEQATKTPSSRYTSSSGNENRSNLVVDIELDEHERESPRKVPGFTLESNTMGPQEYSLLENTTHKEEDCKMQDSATAGRDDELSITCAAVDVPGSSTQEQDVKELAQTMVRTISFQEKAFDAEASDRKLRKDAKEECFRLWGNKVDNLGELLCFLKLIHKISGPFLINECEERIEAYIRTLCPLGDLSWSKFGPGMNVRRTFELRMFRSLGPPYRHKVQPVDCILNAQFRFLPKGLLSEVYSMLAEVRLSTLDGIVQNSQLSFVETTEELRKEELRAVLRSEPDVFLLHEDYVKLADNEECFIITGISEN